MDRYLLTGLIFLGIGFLMIFLGYLIRFKGRTDLIAGYSRDRVADESGLGTWMGNGAIVLGLSGIVIGVLLPLMPQTLLLLVILYSAINLIGSIVMIRGSRRYVV